MSWDNWLAVAAIVISGTIGSWTLFQNRGRRKREIASFRLAHLPMLAGLETESSWTDDGHGRGTLRIVFVNTGGGPAFMETGSARWTFRSGTESESVTGTFDNPVVGPNVWVAASFDDVLPLSGDRSDDSYVQVSGVYHDVFGGSCDIAVTLKHLRPSDRTQTMSASLGNLEIESETLVKVKEDLK